MGDKIEIRVQGQEHKVYYNQPDPERIKMYYEYTEDNFRKGKDYSLKLKKFARVSAWRKDEKGLFLLMEGDCIYNTQVDSDGELRPVIDTAQEEHFCGFIRIEIYRYGIFRMLAGEGEEEKQHHTVMMEGVPELIADEYNAYEDNGMICIETDTCNAVINTKEFGFAICNKEGKPIYRQENDDKVLSFTYESFPFGFAENPATREKIAVCSSRMEHDESFFGFGEQYSAVDKMMQEVDVFITDPLSVGTPRTYASLPFYFSNKGYGMYVNTHYRSKFFMGNRSNRSTSCHIYGEDIIDIFYIYGKEPREILRRYTDITGKSPLVPKWSFGLWMSKCSYKTEEEVMSVAVEMRKRDIPCDVINIDTDWFEVPWACDWKFGKHNFPNPETMIKELSDMGIKLCLWQKPYITMESLPQLTKEMKEKGWLPLNQFGEIARSNPVIDLSNPECVRWYKDQLIRLHKTGVKVIKTDMGEGVPIEGSYYGYTGAEIRNIYPYLYSRAAYEAAEEAGCEPMLWGRSTYAGGQKYPIHWAGDPFTDFDGLRFSIRSGLSMGMSGFTYWSHDIGGFLGRPEKDVYIRWVQAGMFCSHTRCHGANNPREPWTFGEDAVIIFRKFDKLRYRLIPYIYSSAYIKGKDGLPMMEHLYLANPGDRNCLSIDDQWMFGDALLVAPIMSEDNQREVYFPEGRWYHYFSDTIEDGNCYKTVNMGMDDMPLYVKAGSIIPMGKVSDFIAEEKEEHLIIYIYYKTCGETKFIYFDGEEHEITALFEENKVRIQFKSLPGRHTICLVKEGGVEKKEEVDRMCEFTW